MRIGASTYSKEPFPRQVAELRESGFDYAELDLTWITAEPPKLREQATELANRLPLETAHLPPSRFTHADLARAVGFVDALAPLGTRSFNAHFLEARASPRVSPEVKTSWFADLVRAATDRGVVLTLENVDEPPDLLRRALDAVPDFRACLDVGHAHLDGRTDGARAYLDALGDRLDLVHLHDNHGGHGEPGDEHLPFGQGTIDVERDVRALGALGYDGRVTLEIFKGTPDDRRACLRKMRRWARPSGSVESPRA
ncbi:MAG: sugar phosphate isomerase/epimerase family protein [Methanobacteriota archaeon]